MRHENKDDDILVKRHQIYENAESKKPERWSGNTRNWSPITKVALSPTNNEKVNANKAA
jgi:putative transposase